MKAKKANSFFLQLGESFNSALNLFFYDLPSVLILESSESFEFSFLILSIKWLTHS